MDKNYHSRLLDISKRLDHVIERLKSSYIDEKYSNWVIWLLLAPFRDLAKIKDIQQGMMRFSSVLLAFIPIVSTGTGTFVLEGMDIPAYFKPVITGAAGYLFSLAFYFPQLLNFKSEHFHTGAYRIWRRQEYDIFRTAFLDNKNDFYFKGLYDYVTKAGEVYQMVDRRLSDYLQNERTNYKSEIRNLQEQLDLVNKNAEQITKDFQDFTDDLIEERDELFVELEYLIQLLKDVNMLLFRMFNGEFNRGDLDVLTGFTLYELREDKLCLIKDRKTSGASPKEISLHDPKYAHYGTVRVILDNSRSKPYINTSYTGHVVVSFRLNMDNKGVWVYNFHFDESDHRSWKLLVENGNIDSREIYRLIHALCLLSLDEHYFSDKEAVSK